MSNFQSILGYFGVKSQQELKEFIEANPRDERVMELKELLVTLNKDSSDQDE